MNGSSMIPDEKCGRYPWSSDRIARADRGLTHACTATSSGKNSRVPSRVIKFYPMANKADR